MCWGAVGMLGWALVEGVRSLDLGALAWDEAGPHIAGGAILAAAIYQLSRPKNRSLRRCRIRARSSPSTEAADFPITR
jgi:predicted metal-binding membrane protein